jgi:Family of unknown function (DUF5340)
LEVNKLHLPSLIHYELVLQILEKQTLPGSDEQDPAIRQQVQQLIVTMRKAIAQQRLLAEDCDRRHIAVEQTWGLNQPTATATIVDNTNTVAL